MECLKHACFMHVSAHFMWLKPERFVHEISSNNIEISCTILLLHAWFLKRAGIWDVFQVWDMHGILVPIFHAWNMHVSWIEYLYNVLAIILYTSIRYCAPTSRAWASMLNNRRYRLSGKQAKLVGSWIYTYYAVRWDLEQLLHNVLEKVYTVCPRAKKLWVYK